MGLLRLTDLVGEVKATLLNRTDLSSERVTTVLNLAQTEISAIWDFSELKQFYNVSTSFTANAFNDKFVPLAPYVKKVHTCVLLYNTRSAKLREIPWRMFDRLYPSPESIGRSIPSVYSKWGQQIILYPVCDMIYPLFMRVSISPRPFSLSAAPDAVSDFADNKDIILIKLAASYLWKAFGRPDKADDLYLECMGPNPAKQIGGLLGGTIKQDSDEPDMDLGGDMGNMSDFGNYWANPFVRTSP